MDYENPDDPDGGSGSGSSTGEGPGTSTNIYDGADNDAASGWIRDWLSGHPVPGANPDSFMSSYVNERNHGTSHDQALINALRGLGWDQWSPAKGPTAPGGDGSRTGGGLVDPYTAPMPDYIGAPTFTPPGFTKPPAFSYADFKAPTADDVLSEPGYAFGLDQGEQALTQNKAASGLLNTGSTLKDILAFGNNYATGRYNDAYGRAANTYGINRNNALQTYNTNYKTQYVDPYKFAYQAALDTFQPKMADWAAHNNFNWNSYLQGYNMFRNRQIDSVNAATALS